MTCLKCKYAGKVESDGWMMCYNPIRTYDHIHPSGVECGCHYFESEADPEEPTRIGKVTCCPELSDSGESIETLQVNSKFHAIANAIADTVKTKNAQYGDAINATVEFLRLLYPNGIQPEKYNDVGVLVRVYDKLKRIASGHNEDSWEDICGYAILMIERGKRV